MPELATRLLLIGRNPVSGRLRNRAALEKALRAALFVELITSGRIGNLADTPQALTPEPVGDRVLDTVCATVAARPGVAWRRWYRHVAADRVVLAKALIEDGRWHASRDRIGRAIYRDTDPDSSLAQAHVVQQVAELRQQPVDRDQAVLALLAALSGAIVGRPRTRELRGRLAALVDGIGPPSDPLRRDIEAALTGCAAAIRHRSRVLA